MTLDQNKTLARRWFNAWYYGDPAVIDELAAPDFVRMGRSLGHDGAIDMCKSLAVIWGEPDFTIDDVIAEGDKVMIRFSGTAVHRGEMNSPAIGRVPPTGKRANHQGVNIYRIVDGKVADETSQHDTFGVLRSIGAIEIVQPKV